MDIANEFSKRNFLQSLWIPFCALFLLTGQIYSYTNSPLVVNKAEYDFGTISQESTVYVTFTITNVTKKPVRILKIHSSCGCTLVKSLKEVIAPGESLPLEVSFDPRDKYGSSREEIRITYKDPVYPDLVATIKSQISSSIVVIPPEVRFESVSIGNPVKPKSARIIQTDERRNPSLEVIYTGSTSGYFDVQINKNSSGNRFEKQITVIPHRNLPVGVIRDVLSFKTNHPFMKKINLPVYAEIVGNVTVRPEVVLFGFCQPLKVSTKTITIKGNSKELPIKIVKADSDLSQLQIKVQLDRTDKNMYRLLAELKPNQKDDVISGYINIYTTDPYQRLIKIPVIANVVH